MRASLYDMLRGHAEQRPKSVALAAPGYSAVNYGTLLKQVEEMSESLSRMEIGCNDRVAVVLPNGPEMATAFLSVASRATCAPLNPAYRAAEFDFFLADLNARALLIEAGADSPAIESARRLRIPILALSSTKKGNLRVRKVEGGIRRTTSRQGAADTDNVALVLHTSGTTSRPKRVPLTHLNLLASAGNVAASLALSEKDKCLNVMPLFHIHGLVGALLSSLVAGASVVCTSGFLGEQFFQWLDTYQPTWYTAVPTIHQAMLSSAKTHLTVVDRHSLRLIRSCSARLPAGVARELEEVFRVPVVEAYGMTEAAHQIASNPLPPKQRKIGSVGLPTGTEVAVMDDNGHPLPRGEKGEIVVRGNSVITGYAIATSAHERSFTEGWLRTGDQGYLDHDGYVFLTGRLKEIINRGGEKISPMEIDEVLLGHPDVCQAAAFPVPHSTLGEDITALVVLHENAQASEQSLREYLLNRLAEFKVPSRLFIVAQIPTTATGKVSRSQLAAKYERERSKKFPRDGALEKAVMEIYREVLGFQDISGTDNFFALGGDSMRAGQVINRVRARLGVNLTIGLVFRRATVVDLADEIFHLLQSIEGTADEKAHEI
ncbi:MAG: AMP-binding protein [Chloroflexota bacterium]